MKKYILHRQIKNEESLQSKYIGDYKKKLYNNIPCCFLIGTLINETVTRIRRKTLINGGGNSLMRYKVPRLLLVQDFVLSKSLQMFNEKLVLETPRNLFVDV